jgi:hypothetical protein
LFQFVLPRRIDIYRVIPELFKFLDDLVILGLGLTVYRQVFQLLAVQGRGFL